MLVITSLSSQTEERWLKLGVFCFNMLILDQKLRGTSNLKVYSQFTFSRIITALIQANTAEEEDVMQNEDESKKPLQPSRPHHPVL